MEKINVAELLKECPFKMYASELSGSENGCAVLVTTYDH